MYTSKINEVLFDLDSNGVATITLNRPELMNALSWDIYREITAFLQDASEAPEVRSIIFTGAGKNFCAGGDIKRFKQMIDDETYLPVDGINLVGTLARTLRTCKKPIVCKLNGAASGAGAALAMACDLRVMTEKSKLAAGFIGMGFSGDTCGWYSMSRLIGMAKTMEFYMLGEKLNGRECFELGLANRLAEDGGLDEAAYELALKLAESPTVAIGYMKQMFYQLEYRDMAMNTAMEMEFMPKCSRTADHAEAVNAFLEKRTPKFTGQ